jgi:branched-chain amino acid transport system substrate-binding protein
MDQIGLNVYHYTVPENEINDWLVARHLEEFNEPPDLFTAGGMASAIALVSALEATGGDAGSDAMIGALEGLKFEGPKGTYYLRPEDHVCEQPMNILRLVNLEPDLDGDGVPEYAFFETVDLNMTLWVSPARWLAITPLAAATCPLFLRSNL